MRYRDTFKQNKINYKDVQSVTLSHPACHAKYAPTGSEDRIQRAVSRGTCEVVEPYCAQQYSQDACLLHYNFRPKRGSPVDPDALSQLPKKLDAPRIVSGFIVTSLLSGRSWYIHELHFSLASVLLVIPT